RIPTTFPGRLETIPSQTGQPAGQKIGQRGGAGIMIVCEKIGTGSDQPIQNIGNIRTRPAPPPLLSRTLSKILALASKLSSLVLILLVRCSQVCLGPLLPPACRFYPSCSQYFILAVRKHGPVLGACKGVWRICRCHPWHPGAYDPP